MREAYMSKERNSEKKKKPGVHTGHRKRLKQQFLEHGLDRFYDHQALEMLLFYSVPQGDTNPTAHALLERFGSISGILNAPYEDLLEVNGVGENTACFLKFLPEFFARYLLSGLQGEKLDSTYKLCKYFLYKFLPTQNEQLWLTCLDDKLSVVSSVNISEGDGSSVTFDERKILQEALKSKCSTCVLAHNHPFGDSYPSKDDVRLTENIKVALERVNIDLIDHIVVSRTEARSMFHHEVIILEDEIKQ